MKAWYIFALLPWVKFSAAAAVDPKPGEVTGFSAGEMGGEALLYTPKSWKAGEPRRWPVFLYYPGTGGRASLDLARRYAGDDTFFLVGMSYSIRGPISAADHERFYATETANLRAVRDALAEHGADPARLYVGGFSKGGWMASYFADKQPELIAGAAVIGAGRNPFRQEGLPKYPGGLPIYIGVGTAEVNYGLGYAGIEHWKPRGAKVTFDPYLGLGHVPPVDPRSEYLSQWFAVEAYRDRKSLLKPIFDRWHDGSRAAAKAVAVADPVRAYLLLEHMAGAPLAAYLTGTQRAALSGDIAALREDAAVAAELKQRYAYQRIVDKEVLGGYRLRVWVDVIDDYVRLYEAAPKTTVGKRAITDAKRLLDAMRTSVRPEKAEMVKNWFATNAVTVDKIEAAPVAELNRELRELGAFLNAQR